MAPKYHTARTVYRERKQFYEGPSPSLSLSLTLSLPHTRHSHSHSLPSLSLYVPPSFFPNLSNSSSPLYHFPLFLTTLITGIQFNILPVPPTPATLPSQLKQFELWRKLIAYEKENTQRLPPEEHVKRVAYTYSISFLSLRFFPEIWYDAAMFQVAVTGGEEASIRLFERGIKV